MREKRPERKSQSIKNKQGMDYPFLMLVLLLLGFGLIMVFSASYADAYYNKSKPLFYFLKQLTFAGIGLGLMFFFANIDYRALRRYVPLLLVLSLGLLVLVLIIGTGGSEVGARRWINLGFTTFQPSEIAKIALVFTFAHYISIFSDKMKTFKYGVLPFVVILGIFSGLLLMEPHISATVIIAFVAAVMMFIGGINLAWFGSAAAIGGAGLFYVMNFMSYAQKRLQTWKDPFIDPQGKGYQIIQSWYAIGSGGLFGVGFGASRQKYLYLPEAHNDFIFAVICEELGFVGALIVIALFMLLIIRGFYIATHAADKFGTLLAAGLTTIIAVQAGINIAVVTGVFPVTGASLPFFSYGGTSLVILLAQMGVILSISKQIPAAKGG